MTDINSKKNVSQLQKIVIDGLEDVKAQDIKVFNTESLSPLFERVIIASGTSNRQTKALASSVRDAVREAGYPKPRVEGEENGEWIIVDCGAVVAHIMQPAIRQYYHLEEIWGEKPVRFKHGEDKMSELVKERVAKPAQSGKDAKGTNATKSAKPSKSAKPAKGAKDTPSTKSAKSLERVRTDESSTPSKPSTPKAKKNASSSATKATSKTTSKSVSKSASKAASKHKSKPSSKLDSKDESKTKTAQSNTADKAPLKSTRAKPKSASSAPVVKKRNSPPRA